MRRERNNFKLREREREREREGQFIIICIFLLDIEKYVTDGIVLMELRECKESLRASRIYMKTDFKMHVKQVLILGGISYSIFLK